MHGTTLFCPSRSSNEQECECFGEMWIDVEDAPQMKTIHAATEITSLDRPIKVYDRELRSNVSESANRARCFG
jgi:hypothetical protein